MESNNDVARPSRRFRLYALTGIAGVFIAGAVLTACTVLNKPEDVLAKKLASQFPASKIQAVDCNKGIKGLCEVDIGKGVYYASSDGQYFIVGQLLDLKKKVDLTDSRQRELAALTNSTDKVGGGAAVVQPAGMQQQGQQVVGAGQGPATLPQKIKIDLPAENSIVFNRGAPIKLAVFADYNCPHCRDLFEALHSQKDIEVTEYPVAILQGSDVKGRLVMCSSDRVAAAEKAYTQADAQFTTVGDCSKAVAQLKANTDFFSINHMGGTPTIIRTDGTATAGFGSIEQLRAFAGGKA